MEGSIQETHMRFAIIKKILISLNIFNAIKYFYVFSVYFSIFLVCLFACCISIPLILLSRIKIMVCGLNKKVLVGLVDVAFQSQDIIKFLNSLSYKADFIVFEDSLNSSFYHLAPKYIISLPAFLKNIPYVNFFIKKVVLCFYFLFFFLRYDSFILLFKESFLPLSFDCVILNAAGKRVCRCFFGDDIRYRSIQWRIDEKLLKISPPWMNYVAKESNLDFLRTFFTMYFLKLFKIPYWGDKNTCTFAQSSFYRLFCYVEAEQLLFKKARKEPRIIHCPSSRGSKNTNFVLKCIDELKNEGVQFHFELVEKRKNQEVLNLIKSADIVIDQPSTIIARLAAEALAYQCVVITNYKKPYQNYKSFPPIFDYAWDYKNFKKRLKYLIEHPEMRQKIMNGTFEYYSKNHSFQACLEIFKNFFLQTKSPDLKHADNYKNILMESCDNNFQKIIIKIFYNQVSK